MTEDVPQDDGSVELTLSGVYVGNVNPGHVSSRYCTSMHSMRVSDEINGWRSLAGFIEVQSGAQISKARNDVVRAFLDRCDGEEDPADWLLFLDSDMVFPPDLHIRLQVAASRADAEVVGGLCVMVTELGAVPTIYQWDKVPGSKGFTRVSLEYPHDSLVQVAATGTACLMVHKNLLKRMREKYGNDLSYFSEMVVDVEGTPHWVSEDIAFCARAAEFDARIFVDTSTKIGHHKHGRVWTADDVEARTGQPVPKIVAVIPMKDRVDLTSRLVEQLLGSRIDRIHVIDNGSVTPEAVEWLDGYLEGEHPVVRISQRPDDGIHEMWNLGAAMALAEFGERTHVALLNNDIEVAPDFLHLLSSGLVEHPEYMVLGGNYDGRSPGTAVVETDEICADRYDGTGGLPGFAFMVRGELFAGGYRFPENMQWWYGDNDLLLSLAHTRAKAPHLASGYRAGVLTYAHCRHHGAGTARDWTSPEWAPILAADRVAFEEKWSRAGA